MKTSKEITRPCLILSNHQTIIDQFAVGLGFKFGINYIATDTIFRHGILSWFMIVLGRPIPYTKGNSDMIAIKHMLSVIKDGGCIGMFPSGNRSFFGKESTIMPGIGKLAKKFDVPVVIVQIRGGFHTLPRWKKGINRGKMRAAVSKVIRPDELATMTAAEVDEIILKELNFDDFAYNRTAQIAFHGRRKAEYLENVLFYCPECSSLSGLYSEGNVFFCRDCGARVEIDKNGFFVKINKADRIPETILDWSVKQLDYIKGFDFSGFTDKPVFSDNDVILCIAERAKKEKPVGKGSIALYEDRVVVCGQEFLLTEITMSVIGALKMTIFSKDGVYAVLAPYRLNFVKYMICGYHLRYKSLGVKEEYYGY